MKGVFYSSIVAGALLVAGCGGSSSSGGSASIEPGYYRGTFDITSDGGPNGAGPMFLDVVDRNNWEGEAKSDTYYFKVGNTPDGAFLNGGVVITGEATVNETSTGFTFTFSNGSSVTATGELTPAALPSLDALATVPPTNEFVGEFLVVAAGRAKTMGTVTASVDGSGNLTAQLDGGMGFINDGIFAGKFEANGTMSGAAYIAGTVITQSIPPTYSWNGTALKIRFENLLLEGGTCWLILNSPPPVP